MFEEEKAAIRAAIDFLYGILQVQTVEEKVKCHTCGTTIHEGDRIYVVTAIDVDGEQGDKRTFCQPKCRGQHDEQCLQLVLNQT